MSNGTTPNAPPTAKKGLPTLAWVLIGCGGLIVLGLVLFVGAGLFVGNKVKQFAEEAEKNPITAIGKAYAMVTPDVEFVSADEEAKTITLRDTKSGKTVTISADDLDKGRISFETEDGSMTFGGESDDASPPEDALDQSDGP